MVDDRHPALKPSTEATDERLLVEAAQADLSKFDALYELHFDRVYFFIVSRVHDRAVAEDLTSEVFHRALVNLSNGAGLRSYPGFSVLPRMRLLTI